MKTLSTLILAALFATSSLAAQVKDVEFKSHGETLKGHLYLPSDYDGKSQLPTVVIAGSWTSVKEQMSANYAIELAKQGYAALAFDFRGWGESSGNKRFVEDPNEKTQDMIAAARFLKTRPEVNGAQIASLGICAGAGYAVKAYADSTLFKTAAVVAPWLHDGEIVDLVYGGKESVQKLIQAGENARKSFEKTGKNQYVLAASDTDKSAIMFGAKYYTDSNRGLIPQYDNKFNLATWKPWLTFDAIQYADDMRDQVLLVHSEKAAIPQGAKKFANQAGDKAKLVMLSEVTQFDFYDQPAAVSKAAKEVAQHLQNKL